MYSRELTTGGHHLHCSSRCSSGSISQVWTIGNWDCNEIILLYNGDYEKQKCKTSVVGSLGGEVTPWRKGAFIYLSQSDTPRTSVARTAMICHYPHPQGWQQLQDGVPGGQREISVRAERNSKASWSMLDGSTDIRSPMWMALSYVLRTEWMRNTFTLKRLIV